MKVDLLTYGLKNYKIENATDLDIRGITANSKMVGKDFIFVAIKGTKTDGHNFIANAIEQKATLIVVEKNANYDNSLFEDKRVMKIIAEDSKEALSVLSANFYGNPSEEINLVGITGTKGKTTTAHIIKSIFDNANIKSGMIGTIANYVDSVKINSKLTTPDTVEINSLLAQMKDNACTHCAMEVSSHALAQKRVFGLKFNTAIFTNITSDHLDYHETLENYFQAKKIFFDSVDETCNVIVNIDDPREKEIVADSRGKVFTYGKQKSDFMFDDVSFDLTGTRFRIIHDEKIFLAETKLVGEFNVYNAVAAFAAAIVSGLSPQVALKGIRNMKNVPGRFEVYSNVNKMIVIDYAHTTDSLKKVLQLITEVKNGKKVITVFGCGGNRDKIKRPEMGRIASQLSDKVIITSDNPRSEDPHLIIDDIISGIDNRNFTVIENRRKAIETAILDAEDNSIILIAGKGHENYQEVNGVRNHFSDKEIALEFLN